ncbi:MAG: endonuclease III [Gammaproteobacteria bacterium]|nr:endonuclease III [Gammaproteobacteria bacterium]MDE0252686.1 endonuclease III [Gammaproteobacteria bacterium]MDE0403556.1 endonuclease III [Gammaproteobacteria bacterium]
MNQEKRREIFSRFQAANENPVTELQYKTPFQLLVAVVLSAQATDVSVNKATQALFRDAPTPTSMFALGLEKLKEYIKTIGLFNAKAENILKTCDILLTKYDGKVPSEREQLESLPGVGRKTANVILNSAFGKPVIAVDTHIFRVANRTKVATGKNPREVEDRLTRLVPKEYLLGAHHWLILHGRYVCTARKPKCPTCPIEDLCEYRSKNLPN